MPTGRGDAARELAEAHAAKEELIRQTLAIEQASIVAITDVKGKIIYANDTFCNISGYTREDLIGQDHRLLNSGAHPSSLFRSMYRTIGRGQMWRGELCNRAKDGSLYWVDTTIVPKLGANGKPVAYLSMRTDVTKHKTLEQELESHRRRARHSADRLHKVIANVGEGVCMVDSDCRVIGMNDLFIQINGIRAGGIPAGTFLIDIVRETPAGAHLGRRLASMRKPIRGRPRKARWAIQELADGRAVATAVHRIDDGGFVITCRDVTEHHAQVRKIAYLAHHDTVTGLANRVLFRENIETAMRRSKEEPFALLLLDLDHFKVVNDTLGHLSGDKILRAASERLVTAAGPDCVVARLGGDEFAVLARRADDQSALNALATRLITAITEGHFTIGAERISLGVSIGMAAAPRDARCGEELFAKADAALYHAKAAGRATYAAFTAQMEAKIFQRQALIRDLKNALARKQLAVHYQPIVSAAGGHTVGAEALVRWKHPQRGWISPQQFIPLAEETHLINGIGEWVLRTACRTAARWPEPVRIAVNLSPLQLKRGHLRELVASALEQSGLAASRLELEITESVFLDTSESVMSTLHGLRAMGVRIALDDFGTGYSALGYLQSFPFDTIKIDKSFVQNLGAAHRTRAIVNAVSALARELDMEVVAEGVETREQHQLVRAACCQHAQGYLFSAPLPAAKILEYIHGGRFEAPAA